MWLFTAKNEGPDWINEAETMPFAWAGWLALKPRLASAHLCSPGISQPSVNGGR